MLRVKTDGQVIARYGQSRKVEWPWRERALPVCKRYSAPTASESPGERGLTSATYVQMVLLKTGSIVSGIALDRISGKHRPFHVVGAS